MNKIGRTCISSEASNADADVIVDFELLFLVAGEFIGLSFEAAEDDVVL